MPLHALRVHSSPHLRDLSRALTSIANAYDLAADRNIVVHCFDPVDNPRWRKLPAVWHLYDATTIVINMGRIYATMFSAFPGTEMFGEPLRDYKDVRAEHMTWRPIPDGTKVPMPSRALEASLPGTLTSYLQPDREERSRYTTILASGDINTTPVEKTHPPLDRRIELGWSYPRPDYAEYMLYNLLVGVLMRECAYSVFTTPVVGAKWYKQATGYQKNIITVFEELRIEYQQAMRLNGKLNGTARRFMRSAIPVTANTKAVIEDMTRKITSTDGSSGMGAANIGLNSALILGRTHATTLLRHEVEKIRETVEDYLDAPRLKEMDNIWGEYTAIRDGDDENIMPLVERWQALFPSAKSGSNASSSVAPSGGTPEKGEGEEGEGDDADGDGAPGKTQNDGDAGDGLTGDSSFDDITKDGGSDEEDSEGDDAEGHKGQKGGVTSSFNNAGQYDADPDAHDPGNVDETIDASTAGAEKELETSLEDVDPIGNADYEEQDYGPNDLTPSRISYDKAKHRKPMNSAEAIERGREIEPTGLDYNLATKLSKTLENLNVYDRGKFTKRTITPPGRMKSRAAVQQAAERKLQLPANAKPWARTMRTVDINPPLTLGVMTDVSGSQGWAEKISAELAWILSHAVSKIGGKVACVSFGMGVTITQRPGELMHNAQVVRADDGGELFDMGAGTLDTMLNLVNGTGTRMLFVLTDGRYGVGNELQKAAKWVDVLTKSGAYVVWVTPDPTALEPVENRMGVGWGDSSLPMTPEGVIPISAEALQRARSGYRSAGSSVDEETANVINQISQEIQKAVTISKAQAHR